ncbi:MAG: hypothetical protein NTY95_15960 [Bacteroidia bacterium]|nr:hypothetical protein [Bacteroidia bacterium]
MKSSTKIRIFYLLALIFLLSCEKDKKSLPMDADGNTYDTVVIGRQVWLSENLKTTKYNIGTPIPLLTENTAWSGTGQGACCWYENDDYYKDAYGALYNGYAAQLHSVICPVGYHVPTKEEWSMLVIFLEEAPEEVKESFKINQVGFRVWNGTFVNYSSSWWIYSPDGEFYHIYSDNLNITTGMPKNTGYYIRCVKDP